MVRDSDTSRNLTARKILRVVIPLAFWLGVWQLAAVWVDTVYQPGRGYLLLPAPTLVAQRLAALMGDKALLTAAGSNARKTIARPWSEIADEVYDRYLHLIRRLKTGVA